jgi:large subunit ribosomal protein L17
MRHQKNTKKLHRTEEERVRLKKDLAIALIKHGQITTYTVRAKWFTTFFERLVTLVKRAGEDMTLAMRRLRPYMDEKTAKQMYEKVVPKLKDRKGGYTRILKYQDKFSNHDKSIVTIVE